MHYLIKKIIWKIVNLSPKFLRNKFIRMQFKVDPPAGEYAKIFYKIAESREELEQAFMLIQASYVETDLIEGDPLSMRLSKFNALPTTLVFIALYKGEVIATLSQVMDTALGLPIESFSNLTKLKESGRRISEISGLAIKKEWRSRSTGVFFPLASFTILYCQKYVGIDYFVIVTRAHVRFFYQALFNFEGIEGEVRKHAGVNQKESYAQYLQVDSLVQFYKKYFNNEKCGYNLLDIACGFPESFPWMDQINIRKLKYNICSNQLLSKEDLKYFFVENTRIFKDMTSQDLKSLKSIYRFTPGEEILPVEDYDFEDRKDQRFIVNLDFSYQVENNNEIHFGRVIEISKGGIAVLFESKEHVCFNLMGTIVLNDEKETKFKARACWTEGHRVGYKITLIDSKKWDDIIKYCVDYSCHRMLWEFELAG